MNRWGYVVLAGLAIALLVYLLRSPSDGPESFRVVWRGDIPTTFTLYSPEVEQRVDSGMVHLHGLIRPADRQAVSNLWQQFSSLRANRFRPVDESDLAAFGIGDWRLSAEGIDLRWGHRDNQAYLYNGASGELAVLNRATFDTLSRAAGRLDQRQLLSGMGFWQELSWPQGNLLLRRDEAGGWRDSHDDQRPPITQRVQQLRSQLESLALRQFRSERRSEEEVLLQQLHFQTVDGQSHHLQWFMREDQQHLQLDDLPPQALDLRARSALMESLQALTEDPLFEIPLRGLQPTIARAEIWRDGAWWFAIDSEESPTQMDEFNYSIRWEGGRESIPVRSVWALQQALGEILIEGVSSVANQSLSQWQASHGQGQGLFHLRIWDSRDRLLGELHWAGDQARSASHKGRVKSWPSLFAELTPAAFLDPKLLPNIDPERILKFQRVRYDADGQPAAEVFAQSGGSWRQLLPADGNPVSASLQRVLSDVLASEARRVHLIDESLPNPEASIALRIGGILGDAMFDGRQELDLEDTMDRDWGLNLYRHDESVWMGHLVEAGLLYEIPDEIVSAWFLPVDAPPLIPVLANLILAIDIEGVEEPYRLRRTSDGLWRLRRADDEIDADPAEVRRLLQELASLVAIDPNPGAAVLSAAETEARISISIPGEYETTDRIIVAIGEQRESQRVVSVHRQGSQTRAWGRMQADAVGLEAILAPARRYVPVTAHD
ncbi:MAG: hypothetical protein EA402_03630 [Planctomycetota bacterium]|nr:MAG: hypothetical protein EA402_03630 [Planctomycetota bacterium]